MESISIRRAEAKDAAQLAALRAALFDELGQGRSADDQPPFLADATQAFADGMTREACIAWLAEDAVGNAIGSLAMLVFPRLPSPALRGSREGYLLSVFTVPAWRRRGVSRALVAVAIQHAKEQRFARIRLHASVFGRPVYEEAGFMPRVDEMELRLG